MVNASVSVIMDRTRLTIFDKDLPTYKFDDVYPTPHEALVAVNRTVSYHDKSSELVIVIKRETFSPERGNG